MKIRRTPLFIASFFLFFGIFSYTSAQSTGLFQRNLSVGTSGQDVLQLQKILNENPITQIARSGPGSPGQETTYFGGLTQTAVIVFQQIHSADVLIPAGLGAGNGYVGPLTRAALNKVVLSSNVSTAVSLSPVAQNPVITPPSSAQSQASVESFFSRLSAPSVATSTDINSLPAPVRQFLQTLQIYSVEPFKVVPGTQVTLHGTAFTDEDNTVYIGNTAISNLSSPDTATLVVTVPTTVAPGTYPITVSNKNGTLTSQTSLAKIIITNTQPVIPVIYSITPSTASAADTLTIQGSGFTGNNSILTPLGAYNNAVSSDGKTISLPLASLTNASRIEQWENSSGAAGVSMPVIVVNENGVTASSSYFILK